MCGRFDFDIQHNQELLRIFQATSEKAKLQTGEVFPTHWVPVLRDSIESRNPQAMYWGFPHFKGSGVIINARSETAMEKPMFQSSLMARRCVIPTSGFYEWDQNAKGKEKAKYKFTLPDHSVLYLAGIYSTFPQEGENNPRITLLTTEANPWIRDLHHRMPVVLRPQEVDCWLHGKDFQQLFDRSTVALAKEQVGFPAQLSFFD